MVGPTVRRHDLITYEFIQAVMKVRLRTRRCDTQADVVHFKVANKTGGVMKHEIERGIRRVDARIAHAKAQRTVRPLDQHDEPQGKTLEVFE